MTVTLETFDFYGLVIQIESATPALAEEVRRDFSYFRAPEREADYRVEMIPSEPPYDDLPELQAAFFTPRGVCFRDGTRSYVDYFGRALAVVDRQAGRCTIYGTDSHLVHEIAYLHILSAVGQSLDRHGLHRLHALGVSYQGRGLLLLLPSGGGKSTLALALLERPGFTLVSEDTPLIDRRGWILPFPLRLGIRPERANEFPQRFVRTVRRMEFDPKTLIDLDYFQDRLGAPVPASFLLVGARNLGRGSRIEPLPRRKALAAVVRYMVVGLGVYQGLEFLLERGLGDLLGKSGVVMSRLYNGLRLVSRSRPYRFVMGRDEDKNVETLIEFLRVTSSGENGAGAPEHRS